MWAAVDESMELSIFVNDKYIDFLTINIKLKGFAAGVSNVRNKTKSRRHKVLWISTFNDNNYV